MSYHIGLVYAENDIKLSGPIEPCAVCGKTKQDNDVTDNIGVVYMENDIELF